MNPTTDVFEQRVAALEGGVAALGARLRPGGRDAVDPQPRRAPATTSSRSSVALRRHVQPVHTTPCPRSASRRRFVDGTDPSAFGRAINERTKAVFLETDRQPAPRRPRPRVDRRRGPRPGRAGHRRQHLRAAARAADQARRRHRHPLGDEVDRRPRHGDRRRRRRRRHVRLGGQRAVQAGLRRPGSVATTAISYTAAFGNLAFILKLRVQGLRDIGAGAQPVQRVPVPPGPRDAAAADQRHSENALAVAQWLEDRPEVDLGQLPGPRVAPVAQAGRALPQRRLRRRS